MITLPFLLLALCPFVIFGSDYALILYPLCKSYTFWNIFMILGRNVEQDETTCHIQEWHIWFSYFVVTSPSCLDLILYPLCNTNTLRNILMILCRNVEQDEITCWVQERQLWLSYLWTYFSFLCLNLILCPLCNSNTLHNILMIFGRNVEQDEMTCHLQEWQLWQGWGLAGSEGGGGDGGQGTFVVFFF